MQLRPEVQAFAELMETKLQEHDATKGPTGWKSAWPAALRYMVQDKFDEFVTAYKSGDRTTVRDKSVDAANLFMMLLDVVGELPVA